jgi:hypothetical protein
MNQKQLFLMQRYYSRADEVLNLKEHKHNKEDMAP